MIGSAKLFSSVSILVSFLFCRPVFAGPVQWESAQGESLKLLRSLIQIDTSNPPGNEMKAAELLRRIFKKEGISSAIYQSSPGRGNIVARIKGDGSLKPILLTGHLDVVPVERALWHVPPFEGVVKDGRIWGRGVADMKDLVSIEVMIMVLLKRQNVRLKRDVIFAGVADEEESGEGMRYLVNQHWPEIAAEFAINEGVGHPVLDKKKERVVWVGIQTAQKYTQNVIVKATGTSGHSSTPGSDSAVIALSKAIAKLESFKRPLSENAGTKKYFEEMMKLGEPDPREGAKPSDYATFHDTIAPTILKAGVRINVIPGEAEARVNCRMLPQTDPQEFKKAISDLLTDKNVSVTFPDNGDPPFSFSPPSGAFFDAYAKVVHKHFGPSVPLIPMQGTGSTDSKYLLAKGIAAYGVSAMVDAEPNHDHGNDESISLEGYQGNLKILYDLVLSVATAE